MERCALTKRFMGMAKDCPHRRACTPTPSPSGLLSSSSSSLSLCRASRVLAMASSEDFGLQWQPVFRFEQADLMADAPSLLKTCEDFDWKAQANDLRARATHSLHNALSQAPESQLIDGSLLVASSLCASWRSVRYGCMRIYCVAMLCKDVNESTSNGNGDTWFAVGLALATAALVQFSFHFSALATEEAIQKSEAAEAAARAPGWLTPALLAFPVVSYAVFNVYRDQVNPSAKVTDWMFGVAAVVVIANLVLISTIGVRLY